MDLKKEGKNKGGLGALMVSGQDDGKYFELNVGSGLTDQLRDDIWKNKSIVLGQLVEIRADAATLNQDSENDYVSGTVSEPIYSLRFPRFKSTKCFESWKP
jgi:DNA ligase-1